jgi:Flp pilus assembly protein TadD
VSLADIEAARRLSDLRRAAASAPDDPEPAFVLGRVLAQLGADDELSDLMRELARGARQRGRADVELAAFRFWHEQLPDSPEAGLALAHALAGNGHVAEAAAAFERHMARQGPDLSAMIGLGAALEEMLRFEDAHSVYLQALALAPDNPAVLIHAGLCARDLGLATEARERLERAVALDERSPHAQFNAGLIRLDQGLVPEAAQAFARARSLRRGDPWRRASLGEHLAAPGPDVTDPDWACSRLKLIHDIEQFAHLRTLGRLGPDFDPVIADYRRALDDPSLPEDLYAMVSLDPARYPLLAATWKRPLHVTDPDPPPGALINPDLDWDAIEASYLGTSPNMVTIDGLLTPSALSAIRQWCLENTIWNDPKGGYLGAYLQDGFSSRLLLQTARELAARMPRVIGDRRLGMMWGYKYDSRYAGIGVHADVAAVNVNFWITPDDANLDPQSGGLVVHSHDAPADWGFRRFNAGHEEIYRYLESVGSRAVRVPHRTNRALLFDSDLFHETDAFRFKPGYENRRINITMLFGAREP